MSLSEGLYGAHHRWVRLPRFERLAHALRGLVEDCESILDVGAHDGRVARRVGELVGAQKVCGVDVLVDPEAEIDVSCFDGRALPFDSRSFDAVMLSDVLHHAEDPAALLRESVRVCRRAVAIKDHFQFGSASHAALWMMDLAGNARDRIEVRGGYFDPERLVSMVDQAGGFVRRLHWPLRIHDTPVEWILSSGWHFAARVEPKPPSARSR